MNLVKDVVKAVADAEIQREVGAELPLVLRVGVHLGLAQAIHRQRVIIGGGADGIDEKAGRGKIEGRIDDRSVGRVSLVELDAADFDAELEGVCSANHGQIVDVGKRIAHAGVEFVVGQGGEAGDSDRVRKICESLVGGEDGAAIEAELQFIDEPGRKDVQRFEFPVHRPGCGQLPVVQAVGRNIAVSGIEVETKVGGVGRRKNADRGAAWRSLRDPVAGRSR